MSIRMVKPWIELTPEAVKALPGQTPDLYHQPLQNGYAWPDQLLLVKVVEQLSQKQAWFLVFKSPAE